MSHVLLIVDDEETVLNVLVETLHIENYCVLTAGNGSEALRILGQSRVDLALVDYKLFDMNGFELLKMMKARYPETIRIMLTGKPDLNLITIARKDKDILQGYITKPYDIKALNNTLRMYLFRSNTVNASEKPRNVEEDIDVEKKN